MNEKYNETNSDKLWQTIDKKKVIHGNRAQTMEKVKQKIIQYPKCN